MLTFLKAVLVVMLCAQIYCFAGIWWITESHAALQCRAAGREAINDFYNISNVRCR